jgi:hypothetical protein
MVLKISTKIKVVKIVVLGLYGQILPELRMWMQIIKDISRLILIRSYFLT